jgi:hypothetical protein
MGLIRKVSAGAFVLLKSQDFNILSVPGSLYAQISGPYSGKCCNIEAGSVEFLAKFHTNMGIYGPQHSSQY